MTKRSITVGLIVEGPSDARTVESLTGKLLGDGGCSFCGIVVGTGYSQWLRVGEDVGAKRFPRWHGHFRGEPGIEDARRAVIALRGFVAKDSQPAAVILLRDSDGKPDERRSGLEQARNDGAWPFEVVVGVAHTMSECWVIAAFESKNKAEQQALSKLRTDLGFDPRMSSEQLDAKDKTAKKSPKRVREYLLGADFDREAECWDEINLDELRKRGSGNGLSAFIEEIETRLRHISKQ